MPRLAHYDVGLMAAKTWKEQLAGVMPSNLAEEIVHIGDGIQAGSARFVVTQPRMPCFKLGARFERMDIVKRFLQSGRTGFYLAVVREGAVAAGDAVSLEVRDGSALTVADVVSLYTSEAANQDLLRRAAESAGLPDGWRDYFRNRLAEPGA